MNNYHDIAQQLLSRVNPAAQSGIPSLSPQDLKSIQTFLRSPNGHEAARAAIDKTVAIHQTYGQLQHPPHEEILRNLQQSMTVSDPYAPPPQQGQKANLLSDAMSEVQPSNSPSGSAPSMDSPSPELFPTSPLR